ncbi:hypothetical protein [Caballeronia sordidicola]|nr:hypothetical protein [Caballeronia sordidicola]
MARHVFSLDGVTSANASQVATALANVPGCTIAMHRTAKGNYLIFVETDLSEDDAFDAISKALAHLGVTVHRTIPIRPTVIKPKF